MEQKLVKKWYLSNIAIAVVFSFALLGFPAVLGVIMLVLRWQQDQQNAAVIKKREEEDKAAIAKLKIEYNQLKNIHDDWEETAAQIAENNKIIAEREEKAEKLESRVDSLDGQINRQKNKLAEIKRSYESVIYSMENYSKYGDDYALSEKHLEEINTLAPTVELKLHCMDVKDLRKAYVKNNKLIDALLDRYAGRYTTKANAAIYKLMVIALRAELQNILANLKFEKLDTGVEQIRLTTAKYLAIASDGNQNIVGTITRFVGEVEYLFINAAKIEYNYYVKKEQARQEQAAIREQMRQEAEERKALEAEKKKVEAEEKKYSNEIQKLNVQLASANDEETEKLRARILELQSQLSDVVVKKEEISALANGKAGNVYVISNLGAFGEDVFKIGMTRRLDPMDRINELGSASVPFKFDVHTFIFSDDAVALESKLHDALNEKRVNKVNLRKEFFRTSIDELEELVQSIEPTAEFNRTMAAEEYRQSQSDVIYATTDDAAADMEDDEEEE